MASHTTRLRNPSPDRPWAQPSRWAVLTGFTLLPLLIGEVHVAGAINEWQLVVATAVGAAVGGILLAVAWAAARSNHPLLDVLGQRGVLPMTVLWTIWAAVMGLMNVLWVAEALTTVLPGPPVVWVLLLGIAAGVVAWQWRGGHLLPVATVLAVTLTAGLLIVPHVVAGGDSFLWRMPDGYCTVGCPAIAQPLAVVWPAYWAMLVNVAGLTAATVLLWVPVMGAAGHTPRTRGSGWWSVVSALLITGLVFLVVVAGQVVGGRFLLHSTSTNPARWLLALTGPGAWRDTAVLALTGGAILWLATVWAGGPPSALLAATARRWATGLAAGLTVAGAALFHPLALLSTARVLPLYPRPTQVAHFNAGVDLLSIAYLVAPLVVILLIAWALPRLRMAQRWGLTALSGGLTAGVWGLAVLVSTHWADGFGYAVGSLIQIARTPSWVRAQADWALAVGMVTAAVVYLALVAVMRWAPWRRADGARHAPDSAA